MTQDLIDRLPELLLQVLTSTVPVIGLALVAGLILNLRNGLKLSLRIAVIGMPRAGKTTLIVKVFDRVMSGRYARFITVNGAETVEKINEYLATLRSGLNLGPTLEKDVFAFRFIYKRKALGFFPVKYDVEVADFPGEYSSDLSSGEEKTASSFSLYRKEFFSWVVRADRYVFVVDAEAFSKASPEQQLEYAIEMTQRIKTSVLLLKQELLDESVYSRPCALVFTKCDALYEIDRDQYPIDVQKNREDYRNEKYGDHTSPEERRVLSAFSDLSEFLGNNFRTSHVIFHSSISNRPHFLVSTDKLIQHMSPL